MFNMITHNADVAILTIAADKDGFETGFSKDGLNREQALLAKTFGINQMICSINKMDDNSVNYSQERFEEIKREVEIYLNEIGFNLNNVQFVPTSGLRGDNMV